MHEQADAVVCLIKNWRRRRWGGNALLGLAKVYTHTHIYSQGGIYIDRQRWPCRYYYSIPVRGASSSCADSAPVTCRCNRADRQCPP